MNNSSDSQRATQHSNMNNNENNENIESSDSSADVHPLRLLDPTVVEENDDFIATGDIDSILCLSYTLEPFRCNTICKLYLRPAPIQPVGNTKLTNYFNKRSSFVDSSVEPPFQYSSDQINPKLPWYEIEIAKIDSCFKLTVTVLCWTVYHR